MQHPHFWYFTGQDCFNYHFISVSKLDDELNLKRFAQIKLTKIKKNTGKFSTIPYLNNNLTNYIILRAE